LISQHELLFASVTQATKPPRGWLCCLLVDHLNQPKLEPFLFGASLRLTLRASALRACLRQSKIAPGDFVSSASRDPDAAHRYTPQPACQPTYGAVDVQGRTNVAGDRMS